MQILWFIINNFLTDATILIGIIVLIGLLVQKKSADQVIIGTMKAIMGVIILNTGSGVMAGVITNYLSPLLLEAFHIEGLVPMTTSVVALATESYGATVAYIIVGAFVVNLILARLTPFKYIFLAGHHFLYVACAMTVAMACVGVSGVPAVIIGSVIAGCMYVFLPAINQKSMNEITDGQSLALGHFGATGYWLAGQAGKIFKGSKDKSTEDLKLPKAFAFAKETVCAVAVVMFLLLSACTLKTGAGFLESELGVTQSAVTFLITQSITFGAGLTVLLQGIRMMISEILAAFEGIAAKVIPDALPALDVPVVFPFAPNAVLIGFVSATVAAIVGSILFSFVVGVFVVPPIIETFFMGGTGGVFGNRTGGVKGAVLGGAINGLLFIVLPYVYFVVCEPLLGSLNVTVVDPDFIWAGILAFLAAMGVSAAAG